MERKNSDEYLGEQISQIIDICDSTKRNISQIEHRSTVKQKKFDSGLSSLTRRIKSLHNQDLDEELVDI